jgi:uncharacterized ubiquitin-like protein YukD
MEESIRTMDLMMACMLPAKKFISPLLDDTVINICVKDNFAFIHSVSKNQMILTKTFCRTMPQHDSRF